MGGGACRDQILTAYGGGMQLKAFIRDIPDFPIPGILFRDITPLLRDTKAFRYTIDQLAARFGEDPPDAIAAIPEIPRTLNGKKLEIPVKRILSGVALERVVSEELGLPPLDLERSVATPGEGAALLPGPA